MRRRIARLHTRFAARRSAPKFDLAPGERAYVEKPRSGRPFPRSCRSAWRPAAARITQLFGDSATYDWSPHHGRAGLVFVDGSHAYDYVRADSETALRLVQPGGVVMWHDYGVWEGVTRALEEIEAQDLGLGISAALACVMAAPAPQLTAWPWGWTGHRDP